MFINTGNPLLLKDGIGKPKPCTRNLMESDFSYGYKQVVSPEGVKECSLIRHSQPDRTQTTRKTTPRQKLRANKQNGVFQKVQKQQRVRRVREVKGHPTEIQRRHSRIRQHVAQPGVRVRRPKQTLHSHQNGHELTKQLIISATKQRRVRSTSTSIWINNEVWFNRSNSKRQKHRNCRKTNRPKTQRTSSATNRPNFSKWKSSKQSSPKSTKSPGRWKFGLNQFRRIES